MNGIALALLLHSCAPQVHPQTIAAIISVESRGWPWTVHDSTADKSYSLATYKDAVLVGDYLVRHGHSTDLGIAQINSGNLASYGLSVASVMQPCTNIRTGASILTRAYVGARSHFGTAWADANPTATVRYAISAYNTGSLFAGGAYVAKVVAAANGIGEVPTFRTPRLVAAGPIQRLIESIQPAFESLPAKPNHHDMVVKMLPVVYEERTER